MKGASDNLRPHTVEEQLTGSMQQLSICKELSDVGSAADVASASQSQKNQLPACSPTSAGKQQEAAAAEQGQHVLLRATQPDALPTQHAGIQHPETGVASSAVGLQRKPASQLVDEQQLLQQAAKDDILEDVVQKEPQQEQEQSLQHKHQEQQSQDEEQDNKQEEDKRQEAEQLAATAEGVAEAEAAAAAAAAEEDEEEADEDDDNSEGALAGFLQKLKALAAAKMGQQVTPSAPPQRLLPSLDINGVATLIKDARVKRIVCMCGAGISVSAGITDFRTPGTGLYSQLESYKLPRPEAVFSLEYFRANPEPFHRLAKEMFPGHYKPTVTHYFMSLLHKKGLLLRCFTQNIDSLETLAGLPKPMVVPAHGNFDSASCISCGTAHSTEWVRKTIFAGQICRCSSCSSLVKPDIVFFGEALPEDFDVRRKLDLPQCDLLITMGTSLAVWPFAGLLYDVNPDVPRLLINREVVGLATGYDMMTGNRRSTGYLFHRDDNYRDALYHGDCDDGVRLLSDLLGWRQELEELMLQGHAYMDAEVDRATTSQETKELP